MNNVWVRCFSHFFREWSFESRQNPWKGLTFFSALFTNMRILKFKSQPTIAFSLPSVILTDLLGNKLYFNRFKRSWFLICDWRISIRFVCSYISKFVTCDRNYDWRQPKTSKDSKRCFSVYCCWVLCSMDQLPFIRVEEAVSWTELFNKKNFRPVTSRSYDYRL